MMHGDEWWWIGKDGEGGGHGWLTDKTHEEFSQDSIFFIDTKSRCHPPQYDVWYQIKGDPFIFTKNKATVSYFVTLS
jgi:hypothetical protein